MGIIPDTETLNPLRRVLKPYLAFSSPSSLFRTHRTFRGKGAPTDLLSQGPCVIKGTLLSVLENQITDVTNGKSQVLVVQRDLGRRGLHLFHCQSRAFSGRRWRSKSQTLKNGSCYLHLLHLVPQGPAQWLQQFSANAEMMKYGQGWTSINRFGWWEHTQLMPTSRFDDRLLWWNVNQHICFCNICKSIQQVSALLTCHFQHPVQIENGYTG